MIRLVRAVVDDEALMLSWRNSAAEHAAGDGHRVTTEEHAAWWREHVLSPDCDLFLITQPIGFVRLDHRARETEVSVFVEPNQRQRGIGRAAVSMALKDVERPAMAIVRHENIPSRDLFSSLRFVPVEMTRETIRYRRDPT